MNTLLSLLFILMSVASCAQKEIKSSDIITGAERTEAYFNLLKGKRLALVVNQTSLVASTHLVDTLVRSGFEISKIFALEHGFRGEKDRGESFSNETDDATGIPIASLYGKKKKPAQEDLENIDLVLFDIQDVGARFYTYISSLHYIMEACAEFNVELIILDRPNPNIDCVDGPVLQDEYRSFVGMHEVPVLYGMTIGEYGKMINGESWLDKSLKCKLSVINCANFTRNSVYDLPVKPSPNLPSYNSIRHYPSLCFFEGTDVSVGRGTDFPFECFGHPAWKSSTDFEFTPRPQTGASKPLHNLVPCYGFDLRDIPAQPGKLDLQWLLRAYTISKDKNIRFFTNESFFDLLAGSDKLRLDIIDGKTENEIRQSWADELERFKELRIKYLIY